MMLRRNATEPTISSQLFLCPAKMLRCLLKVARPAKFKGGKAFEATALGLKRVPVQPVRSCFRSGEHAARFDELVLLLTEGVWEQSSQWGQFAMSRQNLLISSMLDKTLRTGFMVTVPHVGPWVRPTLSLHNNSHLAQRPIGRQQTLSTEAMPGFPV
eukprot:CAMPEP_0172656616 /NCGR_PEP_ID=MMETSP1074-20121228/1485_1 /TAXON_ID=2916 /ORGANISM="Ceratium fusus, Strain PA161109" /LENGTH=156 /DNA_ID=CAMNT_0013471489 /DNA_START=298 /DNA_END=770 /DNA_ORIENTATION=+